MDRLRFFERHVGLWAMLCVVGNAGALWAAFSSPRPWVGRVFVIAFAVGVACFFLAWIQARGK
jgi:hypothetical protein